MPDGPKQTEASIIWSSPLFSRFMIETYDDECILYNTLSGETHVLNQESHQILLAIKSTPQTPRMLVERAAHSLTTEMIDSHLKILEKWGLAQKTLTQKH
jgi:PqqD family protein of HPr-rel-A system